MSTQPVTSGSHTHDPDYLHRPSNGMSRLKRCPACEMEFGHNAGPVRDRHFLHGHGPADFGLTPLRNPGLSDAQRRIKDWLYSVYWGDQRTVADIADQVGVSQSTARKKMQQLGIPRRVPNAHRADVADWIGFYDDNDEAPEVAGHGD